MPAAAVYFDPDVRFEETLGRFDAPSDDPTDEGSTVIWFILLDLKLPHLT